MSTENEHQFGHALDPRGDAPTKCQCGHHVSDHIPMGNWCRNSGCDCNKFTPISTKTEGDHAHNWIYTGQDYYRCSVCGMVESGHASENPKPIKEGDAPCPTTDHSPDCPVGRAAVPPSDPVGQAAKNAAIRCAEISAFCPELAYGLLIQEAITSSTAELRQQNERLTAELAQAKELFYQQGLKWGEKVDDLRSELAQAREELNKAWIRHGDIREQSEGLKDERDSIQSQLVESELARERMRSALSDVSECLEGELSRRGCQTQSAALKSDSDSFSGLRALDSARAALSDQPSGTLEKEGCKD